LRQGGELALDGDDRRPAGRHNRGFSRATTARGARSGASQVRASAAGGAAVRRRRVAENAGDAMNFKGTVTINAPREKVWAFLTDPSRLTECAPGLESLDVIVPNEKFRAV